MFAEYANNEEGNFYTFVRTCRDQVEKRYDMYNIEEKEQLSYCTLCPRECGVNRFDGGTGYCGMDAGMNIASICIHRGEEPAISGPYGICNIFFEGCNLRCIYCQNHDISRPGTEFIRSPATLEETLDWCCGVYLRNVKTNK